MEIIRKQRCAIATAKGNFVTAVNKGGMGEAANKLPLHTDATKLGSWELFELVDVGAGQVAIKTVDGSYLSAVNGGGEGEQANHYPIHTDSNHIDSWEIFNICYLDSGKCAIETASGNYLTAVKGGGVHEAKSAICTDAKSVGAYERFSIVKLPDLR